MNIYGFCPLGYEGILVAIEVELRRGIPGIDLVGLPDSSVREARERVRAALRNSGFSIPKGRILINLRPAGVRKVGASYDMAIAAAILTVSGQIHWREEESCLILGELSLDGNVQGVKGLPGAINLALAKGIHSCIGPLQQMRQWQGDKGINLHGIINLKELAAPTIPITRKDIEKVGVSPYESLGKPLNNPNMLDGTPDSFLNLPPFQRLAAVTGIAGHHHTLLLGPPGSGKSSLMEYLQTIPLATQNEDTYELQRISALSDFEGMEPKQPSIPMRKPHHTTSFEGMFGGGRLLRPGEVSLAHSGILLLDEFQNFSSKVIAGLRMPMENKSVTVSRADMTSSFPCEFTLVAGMNLCPCGGLGGDGCCLCDPRQLSRYWAKIGAPLLDRFDIRIFSTQEANCAGIPDWINDSNEVVLRINSAQKRQYARRGLTNAKFNGRILGIHLQSLFPDMWSESDKKSVRDSASILRTALTLADLNYRERPVDDDLNLAKKFRNPEMGVYDVFSVIGK